MEKITLVSEDGSSQDFFSQAHVDAAVKAATDAVVPAPVVEPTDTEVDIVRTDGTVQKFTLPA